MEQQSTFWEKHCLGDVPRVNLPFYIGLSGCNEKETVPGQLIVNSFTVTDTTGAPVPDIEVRDVWVSVDGKVLGVFPLPATIPLPYTGRLQLRLHPGVIADRVQGQRIQYPFYGFYQDTINFSPDTRLSLNPQVTLLKGVKRPYPFEETFETTPLSVDSGYGGVRRVTLSADGVSPAGGQFYGRVDAPPAGKELKLLEITQKTAIPLSASGRPIYLEMLYKNSKPMQVGIYAVRASGDTDGVLPRVVLAQSDEWKKAYIFLSNSVVDAGTSAGYKFKVVCRAVADSNKPSYIAVDNLRLVQYK